MIVTRSSVQQPTPTPTTPGVATLVPSGGHVESSFVEEVGATVYLTGSDGSVWNLTSGPVRLLPGVVGLLPQNVGLRWSSAPSLPGAVRVGYGVGTQPVRLPVLVGAEDALGWRDLDASLWRALGYDAECQLTVIAPDAETRVLPVWFVGPGDGAEYPNDPLADTYATYRLEFEAEDPYWQGATDVQTFKPATAVQYYAPAGSAYVKALMPNNSTASATLRNDGDVPAWPVYSVTGSVTNFTIGVGGQNISYGAVTAGATVWIDTHPTRQTVGYSRGDNDEAAWLGVTARSFASVPPGGEVPFTVTLTAPGATASVSVELAPRYRRPW